MFDEIAVAIEGTEWNLRAAAIAEALAHQLGVPWSVLSIVRDENAVGRHAEILRIKLSEVGIAQARIEVIADRDAAGRLTDLVGERSATLWCLSTVARQPVGNALLGSVASQVLRETGMPIVLCGPNVGRRRGPKLESIMICLDTSSLSEAILPVAGELAARTGARPCLVQVLPTDRARLKEASDTAGEASYLRQIASLLRERHGLGADWDVLHGDDPGQTIADYARGLPGAMIAMTTHGRSGLSQVIAGSVASRAIRNADCPVLVLRP